MIGSIIVGAVVGAIASRLMNADSGLFMNIVIGIVGSSVGRFLFGLIGFTARGLAGGIVNVIGACVVIAMARKIAG